MSRSVVFLFFFLMRRRPPRSTRTDTLFPYTTLVRSSRGFKSGSFDIRAQGVFNGTGNTPVRPETLDAYELGLKSRLFDRRVQIKVAAFRYDWKDLQTFGQVPVLGPAFINLPKARLTGVEAEEIGKAHV